LAGGDLTGQQVLEVGCGRGVGVEMLLDRLHAAHVAAFDIDPSMVDRAKRRLHGRQPGSWSVSTGDAGEIATCSGSIDTVVEFGVIHHVPEWRTAIAEIARVLKPDGLLLFEDIPGHVLDTWVMRTFTVHPREDRFEADEFAEALASHALAPPSVPEHHYAGLGFAGAAHKR
jgi:ubiquinone/menaquinone biosynthesis C-methylase UbiE